VGTIAYMSPEQARGRPVDKRTDVWSFGCTLYETLTGKAPFRGESVFDTIARIIERDPDWSELPTDVPPRVHRVLRRCLAKDPAQRFGSIETARDELAAPAPGGSRRTIAVTTLSVLSLFVLLAVWWAVSNRSPEADGSGEPAVEAPVVAVAEMRNLTGDSRLDWLGEGLANLVRDRLSESRHVAVVSRSRWDAIVARNDEAEDPGGLAAVSGIDYLVSGELLSAPDGLVLTARVTDVRHGVDAVARRFDGQDEQALLDSTNQLALLAKQALGVPHTETVEVFAADFAAQHPAAYESYLAGLQYFDGFDFDSAERAFRTALDLEPEYHVARYRLAHVLYVNGRVAEAQQAIDEIPDDAELSPRARLYIDAARALFERDWEAAKTRYRALLDEFPYEIEARQFLAEVYDAEYDDESALEQLRILAEQEPEKPAFWSSLGETYLRVGQLEQAAEAVDRYQRLEPEDPYGFSVLGDIERVRGRLDLAESRYRHALELDPAFQLARLGLATTLAVGGSHAEAETLWSEMVADADEQPGFRIDAAFELSYLLQSRGRFGESIAPLVALEAQIEEEGFREALGFVVRGIARLELGELEEAGALIDRAVEHAPSAPTRYLFARGRLQLELGNLEAVRATAEEIRTFDLPPEEEDRAEERAAAYLEALVFLAEGDAPRAVESARQAVELVGYPYALYRLGLVEALRSTGRRAEAAEVAAAAANDRDPVDPRLDLELDRTRAMLAEAEIRSELGQDDRARRLALECLSRWADADPALTEVAPARRLSGRP
jgi:tetratricopeptide (TPR) repeat protein